MNHNGHIGVNAHLARKELLLKVKQWGMETVRGDVNWSDVEPERGTFIWDGIDQFVNDLTEVGLNGYLTIAYTPAWACNGNPNNSTPPTDPMDVFRFVRAVVDRYKNVISAWGLWNEPESRWNGSIESFVNVVMEYGARAIREADPNALVCGPDTGKPVTLREIMNRGGGALLDVITFHVYASNGHNVMRTVKNTIAPMLRDAGLIGKPRWLTETGWNTRKVSEAQQASYIDQLLESFPDSGLDMMLLFDLIDEGHGWGLLQSDTSDKLCVATVRSRIQQQRPVG
jgi:Cellulase (glycosyl hydrolase family 5)